MENREFYVYRWMDDNIGQPFYVGKGKGDRWRKGRTKRNKDFSDYLVSCGNYHPEIIVGGLTEDEAYAMEKKTITEYKELGYPLTNRCDGGRGAPGRIITDEYRLKYHFMCLGENNPNYGNRWSQEQKDSLSRKRIESGIAKGAKNPRAKRIMCVETGVIFECQQEASDLLGLRSMASINHALKQRRFVAGGYHFVTGDDIERLDTEGKRKQYLIEVEEESRLARQRALNNPEYQGKS